jgi:ribosomal protein S18 acetylase RimI-like enzyme
MAALSEAQPLELVDLRRISAADLSHLLEHELRDWRRSLDWDFRPSAELVRRFVGMQALSGYALLAGRRVAGYSYFVTEERKGLVGDLYVLHEHRTPRNENALLEAVLNDLLAIPYLRRVEAQLMMMVVPNGRNLPKGEFLSVHPRNFMVFDLCRTSELPPGAAAARLHFETWSDGRQEEAGRVIAEAYAGHVDSGINDQYRSAGGARRFLTNIVQYPGCGQFFQPASLLASDVSTGRLCGVCLASLLARDVGHITQICVSPPMQGIGAGYELLRRSLAVLAASGCRKASLTVTAANTGAVRLYERVGFATIRQFPALVWEGFAKDIW